MKQEVKVMGYEPCARCGKPAKMEARIYAVDFNTEDELQQWFLDLCNTSRSEFAFIPCQLCRAPSPAQKETFDPWKS